MRSDQNGTTSGMTSDSSSDDWGMCSPGELQRMVSRLGEAQRGVARGRLYRRSALAMLLVAATVTVGGSLLQSDMPVYGGLTCTECRSHLAAYHANLTGESKLDDASLANSMKIHLAECQTCRGKFNTMYPGVLSNSNLSDIDSPRLSSRGSAYPVFAVVRTPLGL